MGMSQEVMSIPGSYQGRARVIKEENIVQFLLRGAHSIRSLVGGAISVFNGGRGRCGTIRSR